MLMPDGVRVSPTRLFPPPPLFPAPTLEDLGLAKAAYLLAELGDLGIRTLGQVQAIDAADWAQLIPGQRRDLWHDIAQLLVSIGNVSRLLLSALVEVSALINHARAITDVIEQDVSRNRAVFLLEAADQFLVSVGHQLTCVAYRLCALDASTSVRLRKIKKCKDVLEAIDRGDPVKAWPFHSDARAGVTEALSINSAAARCLLEAGSLYDENQWNTMVESRNTWFHRLRPDFMLRGVLSPEELDDHLTNTLDAARAAGAFLRRFALGLLDTGRDIAQQTNILLLPDTQLLVVDGVDICQSGRTARTDIDSLDV